MEILEEMIEIFSEMLKGMKILLITIKDGLLTINANPFIAAIRKTLSIFLGTVGAIAIIINWIKSKT